MSAHTELPAGRELDALVAEKIMGWHGPALWADDEEGRDPYLFEPATDPEHIATNNRDWDCLVPRYSTSIDDALEIVSHYRRQGITLAIDHALPAPLAICRSAFKAVHP